MSSVFLPNLRIGDRVEVLITYHDAMTIPQTFCFWTITKIIDIKDTPVRQALTHPYFTIDPEWSNISADTVAMPGTHCLKYDTIENRDSLFGFNTNTIIYSKYHKSILFMDNEFKMCSFDTINNLYSSIPSIIYPSDINGITRQKFLTMNEKNNILYMVSGNDEFEMIEKYCLTTNKLIELNPYSVKCNGSLHNDFIAEFIEPRGELHAMTFDSNYNAIHYKYDEDEMKFVQLSEIQNIFEKNTFTFRYDSKLFYISSLQKLILTVRNERSFRIYYCDVTGTNTNYQWRQFQFSNVTQHTQERSCGISIFTAYDHVLFVANSRKMCCYDLFYGIMYDIIRQPPYFRGTVVNNNDQFLHFLQRRKYVFSHDNDLSDHSVYELEDIAPLKLKQFYKDRNDKLTFAFVRAQKYKFNVAVVIIQCISNYYNLFQ
eukprot:76057_1